MKHCIVCKPLDRNQVFLRNSLFRRFLKFIAAFRISFSIAARKRSPRDACKLLVWRREQLRQATVRRGRYSTPTSHKMCIFLKGDELSTSTQVCTDLHLGMVAHSELDLDRGEAEVEHTTIEIKRSHPFLLSSVSLSDAEERRLDCALLPCR
jgi:hypothetical protein